jgi:peroxiredoxin
LAKTPEIGQAAPDFTLPGMDLQGGEAVRADYALSANRGKPLVLAFYPGDNSAVCTRQLCSYTSGLADGILRWKHVTLVGLTFPSTQTIVAQLAPLKVG